MPQESLKDRIARLNREARAARKMGDAAGARRAERKVRRARADRGDILSDFGQGAGARPSTAGINYLQSWAGIITLNFSFFSGPAQIIRWLLLAIFSVPLLAELTTRLLG